MDNSNSSNGDAEGNKFVERHRSDHEQVNEVEGEDEDGMTREGGSSGGVGGSRWNPTKEQIEMLERMYSNEGVRTPTADQIQQITSRLKVYGHIEGKNVFYWFQNHKARQRQKQRQQRHAAPHSTPATLNLNLNYHNNHNHHLNFNNPFLVPTPPPTPLPLHHHHHYINLNTTNNNNNSCNNPGFGNAVNLHPNPILPAPPIPPPPPPPPHLHHTYPQHYIPNPNVISSPYYRLPHTSNDLGYNNPPQYNYSAPPNDHHDALMKRSSFTGMELTLGSGGVSHGSTLTGYCAATVNNCHYDHHIHGVRDMTRTTTLDLFPVHPTGILEHKFGMSSTINSPDRSGSCDINAFGDDNNNNNKHQRLFDFFSSSGRASCESN